MNGHLLSASDNLCQSHRGFDQAMEMEERETDAKVRSRRRRSIRNLRESLPNPKASDDCYGSTWLESEEPVRKRKKRRSSIFVGLPALQSTPLREEAVDLLNSSVNICHTENHQIQEDGGEETIKGSCLQTEGPDFLTDIDHSHAVNHSLNDINTESMKQQTVETEEKCNKSYETIYTLLNNESLVDPVSTKRKSNDDDCVQFEDFQEVGETVSSSGSNVTSPGSVAQASPCSMSPDYPISPSYISHFVDHGESFVESDSLQIQSAPTIPMVSIDTKGLNLSSNFNLNLSDKENECLQNLNITPSDIQDLNKSSPGFLSLCKNIAGKVVNFVKTSPNYLTGGMFDSSLSNKTPPVVLQENHSVMNNVNSSITSQVESMHISSTQEGENKDGSYILTKEEMRESVDKTLEEMEAEIASEMASTTKRTMPPTPELKTFPNLKKTVFNYDNGNSQKLESSSRAKNKSRTSSSSGSTKKKRDMTMFLKTFNAISDVYKSKQSSDTSDDVFTDKTDIYPPRSSISRQSQGSFVQGSSEDADFTVSISLPPPRAPDRRKSKGSTSSVSDFDFLDQLMNTETNHSDNPVEISGSQTSVYSASSTQSANIPATGVTLGGEPPNVIPAADTQADKSSNNTPVSHNEEGLPTPDNKVSTPVFDETNEVKECIEQNEKDSSETLDDIEISTERVTKDSLSEGIASSENEINSPVPSSPTEPYSCEEDIVIEMNTDIVARYSESDIRQKYSFQTTESQISPPGVDGENVNTEYVENRLCNVDKVKLPQVDNILKRKHKQQISIKFSVAKTAATKVQKDNTSKMSSEIVAPITMRRKKAGATTVGKRRSGQMKEIPEEDMHSVGMGQEETVVKKKKLSPPATDDRETNATVSTSPFGLDCSLETSEPSSSNELTANIEEKISKLALLVKKKQKTQNPKDGVKKQRRRSGRLPKLSEIENTETIKGSFVVMSDTKNKSTLLPKSVISVIPESVTLVSNSIDTSKAHTKKTDEQATNTKSTVKKKPRGRRSADFKDIPATITSVSPEIAMDVTKLTDEISHVNLSDNRFVGKTQTETDMETVDNLTKEAAAPTKRQRRRSADAASLKIQLVCEQDNKSSSPSSGAVTALKGSRKRKLDSAPSEEELEKLYRNKNFVKPDERRPWQTIYESPATSEKLYGKNKLQRYIEFEKPTLAKLNRRLKKAVKNGWDPRKMRKKELDDEFVKSKLDAMREDLDDSSSSLSDSLKNIIEIN